MKNKATSLIPMRSAGGAIKQVGVGLGKALPWAGIGVGLASAASNFESGNYISGALDIVGLVPLLGDAVDLARTFYAFATIPLNRTNAYNREMSLGPDQSIMKSMGGCQRCHTTNFVREWSLSTPEGRAYVELNGCVSNPNNDLVLDKAYKAMISSWKN
jgi:hypothetical protein